jgi:hypothetical protein
MSAAAAAATPHEWTAEELDQLGIKISEFANDPFNPGYLKRALLTQVSAAVRRFEVLSDVPLT